MYKNSFIRFLIVCFSFSIFSCSTTVIDKVIPPLEAINYQTNIKPIVDANYCFDYYEEGLEYCGLDDEDRYDDYDY